RVRSGRYSDSGFWGPRLEEMLTRAIAAAAQIPGGTLSDAHTLLATGGRTHQVLPAESQSALRELSARVRERPDDAEGARRLLYEVVRSDVLRRMLCEPHPTFRLQDLVRSRRITIISGEAAGVGESVARYLLAVYLALIWSELLARPANAKTFVILDEAQWFSHESLAEMLRLARRRNVHVVLATQTVRALPETVAEALWTNVSDFVAFRGSPEEARELSRTVHGISVEELLALPRGHAAVLLGKGNSQAWIRTVGRPPPPESNTGGLVSETEVPPARPENGEIPRRPATVGAVLDWIRGRIASLPDGGSLRVSLAELRSSVDPEGHAIRGAGARLGRAGAIVSFERTPAGTVWVLDPRRIETMIRESGSQVQS
ncbi:MAG TPA: TraM recognition domain-containing protein, partial [Thermoplasmata archaeon]|nr:TraM recognition domain-containing protein [Thermoplasmata archaeon]